MTSVIVPTRVGVNLPEPQKPDMTIHCPHACGGEPKASLGIEILPVIVPTRVGVNRLGWQWRLGYRHCPHACGGEPSTSFCLTRNSALSPRVWG